MATRTFDIDVNINTSEANSELRRFRQNLDQTEDSATDLTSSITGFTRKLGGMKGALAIAGAAAVVAAGRMSKVTDNLSNLAGTDTRTFQEFALYAREFGFEAEQSANLMKDWNDRMGDFISTGAGPFADVFKLINAGAEDFIGLSFPEALIKLQEEMDAANLSMQQQTFILESLGSDLVLLQKAFGDSGEEYRKFLKEIEGAIASQSAVQQLKDVSTEFDKLTFVAKQAYTEIAAFFAPLAEFIFTKIREGLVYVVKFFKLVNIGALEVSASLEELFGDTEKAEKLRAKSEEIALSITSIGRAAGDAADKQDDLNRKTVTGTEDAAKALEDANKQYSQLAQNLALQIRLESALSDEEKDRINFVSQLQGLSGAQKDALTNLYNQLTAQKELNDSIAEEVRLEDERREAAEDKQKSDEEYIQGLKDKLTLLNTNNDVEKEMVQNAIDIRDADLSGEYRDQADALNEAIILRKEQLRIETEQAKQREKIAADAKKQLEEESKRVDNIDSFTQKLENELTLLRERDKWEKERITNEQEIAALNATEDEAERIAILQEQIIQQEKLNEIYEKQQDSVNDLATAMGRWASGSEDAIQSVIAALLQLLAIETGFGNNSFVSSFLGGFGDIQGFADGGNPPVGRASIVGENGPELIVPRSAMTVIPNHAMSGGVTVNANLNASGGDSSQMQAMFQTFASEIATETQRLLRNQIRPGGII